MERLLAASRSVKVAEHMLTQTMLLVKDSKMLLTVLSHIRDAHLHAINAALLHENKQRPLVTDMNDFSLVFNLFRIKYAKRYGVDVTLLTHIEHVQELFEAHKKSPVEFTRKDDLVICDEGYSTKILSPKGLKEQIGHAKVFIDRVATQFTHAAR